MAKKQYQKLSESWDAKIQRRNNAVEIVIKGWNSKGTEVHVSAIMPDYFIKYLNRDIVEIARQKQNEAIQFFNTIKNQSNQ